MPSYTKLNTWTFSVAFGRNNYQFGGYYSVSKGSFLAITFNSGGRISLTNTDVPLYVDYIWKLTIKELTRYDIPSSRFLFDALIEDSYFIKNLDLSFTFPIDEMYKVYFINYTVDNSNFTYNKTFTFRKLIFYIMFHS